MSYSLVGQAELFVYGISLDQCRLHLLWHRGWEVLACVEKLKQILDDSFTELMILPSPEKKVYPKKTTSCIWATKVYALQSWNH